jgi:hypothetical protein
MSRQRQTLIKLEREKKKNVGKSESPTIFLSLSKTMETLFIKFNDINGNSYTMNISEILMITNKDSNIEVITIYEDSIMIDQETYKSIDNALDNKKLLI